MSEVSWNIRNSSLLNPALYTLAFIFLGSLSKAESLRIAKLSISKRVNRFGTK